MKKVIYLLLPVFLFMGTIEASEFNDKFFEDTHAFLQKVVVNNNVDYSAAKSDASLQALIDEIAKADLSDASTSTKQSFYINTYNLLVIYNIVQAYPVKSTQDIPGFFDRKKHVIGGENMTLNQLEKDFLLKPYKDPRYHFVLVCGALGCPPITNFAYVPEKLEQQIEIQTKNALNDPEFIKVAGDKVSLSNIFNWYKSDFGGNNASVTNFINKYRTNKISSSAKFDYYDYDWSLNEFKKRPKLTVGTVTPSTGGGNNASRYIVSSTIPKGSIETKIFNNLYTQRTGNDDNLTDRSTFFTTSFSLLYGLTNRINVGISTRYRRVRNDKLPSKVFNVFGNTLENGESNRQGFTALGPQIRFAPVPKWSNFSVQSSFVFPIGDDLEGSNGTGPYIDWSGATWWTQFFNDFPIGNSFSIFTEIDLLIEDIGNDNLNRLSTPVTLIFSYNPNSKITIYTIGGYSPYWQDNFDYFTQIGLGAKYQFTPKLELELLYTDFSNKFLNDTGGKAATYNVGFRLNI